MSYRVCVLSCAASRLRVLPLYRYASLPAVILLATTVVLRPAWTLTLLPAVSSLASWVVRSLASVMRFAVLGFGRDVVNIARRTNVDVLTGCQPQVVARPGLTGQNIDITPRINPKVAARCNG